MRRIGISEIWVTSVMCPYERAKTRVRVDFQLSEEFEVNVGIHQGSVLSPFLFAVVVDVVTKLARECVLSVLLYADDLVMIAGLWSKGKMEKWKEAFERKV